MKRLTHRKYKTASYCSQNVVCEKTHRKTWYKTAKGCRWNEGHEKTETQKVPDNKLVQSECRL